MKHKGFELESDKGVLQVWETDSTDVKINADGVVPLTKEASKGIRIKVRKRGSCFGTVSLVPIGHFPAIWIR